MRYLVGLIGSGITESLTPPMHEAEASALALDYEYRILDLARLGRAPDDVGSLLIQARQEGFSAMNITHPCKQRVVDVVDELEEDADHLRAANLVVFVGSRTVAFNTDWMGYRDALIVGLPGASFDRVVQVGCGGAGAATAYALLSHGTATLELCDVDEARREDLAARMRTRFPTQVVRTWPPGEISAAIARASGVVHATPTGMRHHPGVAFDVGLLQPHAWVSDVVYRPLQTELLRQAAERGHRVLDGGLMAVGQAYASLRIITGAQPDRGRMERHFRTLTSAEDRARGRRRS
ncbi:shikimate dehydrogenase [Occultella aeris]|uniref:Quinate/shikimate dehydrogenase n=1 Tax=Occultella aeris TaxID=2761496 RepID=A0A7M4DQT2_9MICO|nr:shikimate dehydrogenase [Occultella aeris]VZO39826.1 Quinate/shikimate dehydrogenase [Occultella aeris]